MPTTTPETICARFDVSRETMDRIEAYVSLLLKWRTKVNLVGASTVKQVWERHVADCLQLADLAGRYAENGRISVLDMGSGGGLPGIPLALRLGQSLRVHVHLVDSNGRKAAFLREAVRVVGIDASVHCRRVEALDPDSVIPEPRVVVSRALAPMDRLSDWAWPWISRRATGLFLKGRNVENEVAETDSSRPMVYTVVPSRFSAEGSIVVVEALDGNTGPLDAS